MRLCATWGKLSLLAALAFSAWQLNAFAEPQYDANTFVCSTNTPANPLTVTQKLRVEQLTNLFENGDTNFHYDYIENLGDGRGFTAGRVGFTTATGDFYSIVQRYSAIKPENPLAAYLPALQSLAEQKSGSTDGLENIETAWRTAAADPAFKQVQDGLVEEWYFQPAMKQADCLGLQSALARAVLYDTIVQHGGGYDGDSLGAIISRTNLKIGGTPATGVDEKQWLMAFLETRRDNLENPVNSATQSVWRESVGRCAVFRSLLEQGRYDLLGALPIHSGGFKAHLE